MSPLSSAPRACPVCDSSGSRRILHRQTFYDGVWGDGYDVVVCAECGAGFADGIPVQEEMDRYYVERSKYTYDATAGAESPYDLGRFELIADQVRPHLRSPAARILDIGCATGGLLSVFKRRGCLNVMGADPSPACADAARRLHGIEVRAATFEQLSNWNEKFDLILMVGVLEHLRDVRAAVKCVSALLAPSGLFYAAVPDVEGLAAAKNAPFQQFSMEHVNFFSVSSLTGLLIRGGFSPIETWQHFVEWREGVTEPVLGGLFAPGQEQAQGVPPPGTFDALTEPALEGYLAASMSADAPLKAQIERLVETQQPFILWGAGALTRRLLRSTSLSRANVVAVVDANPYLQGRELANWSIVSPTELKAGNEPILICSVAFEKEIVQAIRENLRLSNPIVTL